MGNNQSNEREKNWKIYKITRIDDDFSSHFRFYLDDYVTYKDENYKHIDFSKSLFWKPFFLNFEEGNYVRINLGKTCCESRLRNFSITDDRLISKVEVRKSSGIWETTQYIGDLMEERRQLTATMEQSRLANNQSFTKQTSWDMPPGWK